MNALIVTYPLAAGRTAVLAIQTRIEQEAGPDECRPPQAAEALAILARLRANPAPASYQEACVQLPEVLL